MRRFLAASLAVALGATHAFAQSADGGQKKVIGILGQAVKNTPIYSSTSSRSRIYYRVRAYEYLVLNRSNSETYSRVLLRNGRHGYIRRDSVAELPHYVTVPVQTSISAPPPVPMRDTGSASSRAAAAQYGLKFQGTPYKWGGNDPLNGIDCSAFVKFLYGQIGLNLPRTAAQQAMVGMPISRLEDLQAGDRLYFWDSKRGKIGHTGIYLGNGYFVHSSSGKGGVTTDYLGSQKWRSMLVAARR